MEQKYTNLARQLLTQIENGTFNPDIDNLVNIIRSLSCEVIRREDLAKNTVKMIHTDIKKHLYYPRSEEYLAYPRLVIEEKDVNDIIRKAFDSIELLSKDEQNQRKFN